MRKQLKAMFIFLLIVLVTATILQTRFSKKEKSQVRMAVELNDHAAAAYVALDKGWFSKKGINVSAFQTYLTGLQLSAALTRGDIDAGWVCLPPAILAISKGVPVKIVALTHKYGYCLVVSPEIKEIKDLNGKRIGLCREGTPTDILFHVLIKKYNISDVQILRMNPLHQLNAIVSGSVDAVFCPEHYASVIESKGFRVLVESRDLWSNWPGSVLVVKKKFLEEKPGLVKEIVEVTVEATNWINMNRNGAALILSKPEYLKTNASIITRSMSRLKYTNDLNLSSIQKVIDYMTKLGYIGEGVKAEDIVDTSFLNQIREG